MKKIAYVGPSWAVRSFDNPVETDPDGGTNLAKELKLQVTNLSAFGAGNLSCLEKIKNHPDKFDAVLWVYCEPIIDLSHQDIISTMSSENFWELRKDFNLNILDQINRIGCPIGIIGAHSDVADCNFDNITVIHPSWQKFLADTANIDLDQGWGADVSHSYIVYNKEVKPSRKIVDLTADTLKVWNTLELLGLFRWTHPNTKANELFAERIRDDVQRFINNL